MLEKKEFIIHFVAIILLVVFAIIVVILIFTYWALRKILLRNRLAWSGKDIEVKRSKRSSEKNYRRTNAEIGLLSKIDEESNDFLRLQDEDTQNN